MNELPEWEPGTVCVLSTGGGDPHAIPVSTAVRAGPRRVLLALAARRETLARLRREPRCALTIMAGGDVACTVHARAEIVRSRCAVPRAWPRSRSRSTPSRITCSHASPSRPASHGAGPTTMRAPATRPSAPRSMSWRGDSLPAHEARLLPRSRRRTVYGEVRDGRVVAFADGSTVKDRLASGDRTPAAGPDACARRRPAARTPRPARDLRRRPELRRARAGAGRRAARGADRLHEAAQRRRRPAARCARRRSSGAWTTRASSPW